MEAFLHSTRGKRRGPLIHRSRSETMEVSKSPPFAKNWLDCAKKSGGGNKETRGRKRSWKIFSYSSCGLCSTFSSGDLSFVCIPRIYILLESEAVQKSPLALNMTM